jgi:hypothetical protein
MLVRCMVNDQIDQYAYATLLASMSKLHEIAQRAVTRVDAVIIGNIIAIITQRRGLERHQPYGSHAQPMKIIQSPHQAGKVADAVPVGIHVAANGQAVDDRVFVPEITNHELSRSV